MEVRVVAGDITMFQQVDAIATLINPEGAWFGGVDFAIRSVAGGLYHEQALSELINNGLSDGQVLVDRGKHSEHNGLFNDVIFVVDDLEKPVGLLVRVALNAAKKYGYNEIAFPAMRTGVMLGAYPGEPDAFSTVLAIATSLREFYDENPGLELIVYFVIYRDTEVERLFLQETRKLLPR